MTRTENFNRSPEPTRPAGSAAWMGFAAVMLWTMGPVFAMPAERPVPPQVSDLGDGRYSLGEIHINAREHSIRFPALVNMDGGLIEYALVHESGKTHESLLRTHIAPMEIQTALLLARPAASSQKPCDLIIGLEVPGASAPSGSVRLEDWIVNQEKSEPLRRGPWHFIGSRLVDGIFLAQRDGSIIAVMRDPDALVGNPREHNERDDIWEVRPGGVPPVKTVVVVVLRFEATSVKSNQP